MDPHRRACLTALLGGLVGRAQASAADQLRQGLFWLHSFEYDDARAAFARVRALEPASVMAAWGEALTHTEPLWHAQDLPAAQAVLSRLAPDAAGRRAKARTERERDYLAAVEALYGEGSYRARTHAYAEAMRRLATRHPQDLDGVALHALAILGTAHDGRDVPTYMRAAAVAEEVYARDPDHPGALHYLIHCYDDPVHAPLGLRAARRYARVASAAPHALHMPAHIFAALGMWDEVVVANEASWNASEERVQSRRLPTEQRGYHALQWLHYAYLQQGRFREAGQLLAIVRQDATRSPPPYVRQHLALMTAAHVLNTRDATALPASLALDGLDAPAAAAYLFARGYVSRQRAALGTLRALRPQGRSHHDHQTPSDHRAVAIMAQQLEGLLAESGSLAQLAAAARQEDGLPYEAGPPLPAKPAHELLGEALLQAGQPAAARDHFARALARYPGRALSLLGLARAAAAVGDATAARALFAELKQLRRKADTAWTD